MASVRRELPPALAAQVVGIVEVHQNGVLAEVVSLLVQKRKWLLLYTQFPTLVHPLRLALQGRGVRFVIVQRIHRAQVGWRDLDDAPSSPILVSIFEPHV